MAVSNATSEEALEEETVAGFACITEMDDTAERLTLLTPSAGPLPSKLFIVGDLKFMED